MNKNLKVVEVMEMKSQLATDVAVLVLKFHKETGLDVHADGWVEMDGPNVVGKASVEVTLPETRHVAQEYPKG